MSRVAIEFRGGYMRTLPQHLVVVLVERFNNETIDENVRM